MKGYITPTSLSVELIDFTRPGSIFLLIDCPCPCLALRIWETLQTLVDSKLSFFKVSRK